jgi:PKHD-type hydroxylase
MVTRQTKDPAWKPLYFPAIAERLMAPKDCENIIAAATEAGFRPTAVKGGQQPGSHYDSEIRVCDAAVLNPQVHRDAYDFVAEAIKQVNNKQYRFGLVGVEPVQVLRYSVGSFFRDHSDLGYQQDDSAGRKISLIAQLSPESAYAGGELVLFGEEQVPRSQGTVCIFPSWLVHRVERLTAGTRYTLVAWAKGPPFN